MQKVGIRFAVFAALFLMLMPAAGCAKPPENGATSKLRVVTTVFPPYDFVREIAGDRVDLRMILPAGHASHGYEPVLADLADIRRSDLFLMIGDDSDDWAADLNASVFQNTAVLKLGGLFGEDVGEHSWTSVRNAAVMVRAIADTLCRLDEKNAAFYRQNADRYSGKLRALDGDFAHTVRASPLKTVVFADDFPFTCFAKDYGLTVYAAFSHCSEDFEPELGAVAELITRIREESVPLVFTVDQPENDAADLICEATGCDRAVFHACHNLTEEERAAGENYLSFMRQNLEALRKALRYAG